MNTIPYIIKLEDIKSVEQELFNINCDKVGVEIMKAKGLFKVVKIPKVKTKVANVIKQTFLAKGAGTEASPLICRECPFLTVDSRL